MNTNFLFSFKQTFCYCKIIPPLNVIRYISMDVEMPVINIASKVSLMV